MTVHVHKDLSEIAIGGQHVRRDAAMIKAKRKKGEPKVKKADRALVSAYDKGRATELDTDRTWAFDAHPELEARVLREVEFTANHPGGVPLTLAEKSLAEDLEKSSQVEVGRMTQALARLAKEEVTAGSRA